MLNIQTNIGFQSWLHCGMKGYDIILSKKFHMYLRRQHLPLFELPLIIKTPPPKKNPTKQNKQTKTKHHKTMRVMLVV